MKIVGWLIAWKHCNESTWQGMMPGTFSTRKSARESAKYRREHFPGFRYKVIPIRI